MRRNCANFLKAFNLNIFVGNIAEKAVKYALNKYICKYIYEFVCRYVYVCVFSAKIQNQSHTPNFSIKSMSPSCGLKRFISR